MDKEFEGLRMIKEKIHLNPGLLEPLNPYAMVIVAAEPLAKFI
jgi:hypothetical protein